MLLASGHGSSTDAANEAIASSSAVVVANVSGYISIFQ